MACMAAGSRRTATPSRAIETTSSWVNGSWAYRHDVDLDCAGHQPIRHPDTAVLHVLIGAIPGVYGDPRVRSAANSPTTDVA